MPNKTPYNRNVSWRTRYARHRAQAKYRGEAYELTEQEYTELWHAQGFTERHQLTGRGAESISMVRINPKEPWRVSNIQFLTRSEYIQSVRNRYAEIGYMKQR